MASLLALPLLVLRVDADDPHDSLALDHLAVHADLPYRRPYLHFCHPTKSANSWEPRLLLLSLYLSNPPSRPIRLRQLDAHPIAGSEPWKVRREAVGDVCEDLGPVFELDPEHAVGEGLQHDPAHEVGRLGHEL